MNIINSILNRVLTHPAWTGLGVIVAILALVISLFESDDILTKPNLNEDKKIVKDQDTPVFVSQRIALVIGNANYNIKPANSRVFRSIRINSPSYIKASDLKASDLKASDLKANVAHETSDIEKGNTIGSLKNPINDAKSVIKILKKKGFKVIKGFDVSKNELAELVENFQTILSTGGVGLFYYAGHAIRVGGNDFMLPITAEDVSSEENFIMEAVNVTDILKPVENILEEHPSNTGSIVIYSASKGGVALDGVGMEENSPFTNAFVSTLEKQNKEAGIFDIFIDIARITAKKTSETQTPFIAGSTYSNFYFDKQTNDKDISLMKLLFIDACRDNPFEPSR